MIPPQIHAGPPTAELMYPTQNERQEIDDQRLSVFDSPISH